MSKITVQTDVNPEGWGKALQSVAFVRGGGKRPYAVSEMHVNQICLGFFRRVSSARTVNGLLHLPKNPDYDMRNPYLTWLVEESMFSQAYEWAHLVDLSGGVLVKDCILVKPVRSLTKASSVNVFAMLCCLIRHAWEYRHIVEDSWEYFVSKGVDKDFAYILAQCVTPEGQVIAGTLHNPIGPLLYNRASVVSILLRRKLFEPDTEVPFFKRGPEPVLSPGEWKVGEGYVRGPAHLDYILPREKVTFEDWKVLGPYKGPKTTPTTVLDVLGTKREEKKIKKSLWPFVLNPDEIFLRLGGRMGKSLQHGLDVTPIIDDWENLMNKIIETGKADTDDVLTDVNIDDTEE